MQVEVGVPMACRCHTAHSHLERHHPFESSQESLGIGLLAGDVTVTKGSNEVPGKGYQFTPGV